MKGASSRRRCMVCPITATEFVVVGLGGDRRGNGGGESCADSNSSSGGRRRKR